MVAAPLINEFVLPSMSSRISRPLRKLSLRRSISRSARRPAFSTQELVEYARKNPDKLNYGSVGRGSVFHLQGEAMNTAARTRMVHVPYAAASMSNIIGDLLANRLQVFFPAYSTIVGILPLQKITLLGVFANQRLPQRPHLATVQEAVPGLTTVPSWFGLLARLP